MHDATVTTAASRGDPVTIARPAPTLGTTARAVVVASGPVAAAAWWLTGRAAAVPVVLVGAIVIAAACCDRATARIPNSLVLAGVVVVGCGWGFVGAFDERMMDQLARDVGAGLLLSGAPLLFAIWLVAPRLIGGGDWKLLAVMGAAVGYADPSLAALAGMVAFGGALVVAAVTRRRHLPLGPLFALGYWVAAAVAVGSPVPGAMS
jgi:Flp pilus assembly protein protease CpaA